MFIVTYRKFFYALSALLVVASLGALFMWGLLFGIDFKGGSLIEVEYETVRPDKELVAQELDMLSIGDYSIRETGELGFIVRT